jgi:AcrR family transcriptional regulator
MTHRASLGDPRVTRSHQRLRDALLSLTLERGWDDVSVQQVCERAGVGRSTFYVHFADREDLLLGAFQSDHIVPRQLRPEPLAFVRPLIEHVGAHRTLYSALAGTSCEVAVNRRFKQVVANLIDRDLDVRAASAQRESAIRYLTGAFCETLTHWLAQRNAASSGELEQLLKQYSRPVFERLS